MHYRRMALLLAAGLVLLTGCAPKYASKKQIKQYVKDNISEETEYVDKVDEHAYEFRSTQRDLTFTVWTEPESISIDGSFLGYTGDYHIYTDYTDKCYESHNAEVDTLIEKHGFEVLSTSDNTKNIYTGDYYKYFLIVLENNMADWDQRYVNAFLNDLRETVILPEMQYHNGQALDYYYEVNYKIDNETYQRTAGENYENKLYPDTDVDLHEYLHMTDMFVDKALCNPYNGVVIALKDEGRTDD